MQASGLCGRMASGMASCRRLEVPSGPGAPLAAGNLAWMTGRHLRQNAPTPRRRPPDPGRASTNLRRLAASHKQSLTLAALGPWHRKSCLQIGSSPRWLHCRELRETQRIIRIGTHRDATLSTAPTFRSTSRPSNNHRAGIVDLRRRDGSNHRPAPHEGASACRTRKRAASQHNHRFQR